MIASVIRQAVFWGAKCMVICFLFYRLDGTCLFALKAENTFGAVDALAAFLVALDVHRAYFQTFAAADALAFVAVDTEEGKIAHRLQEYGNRADVFAERTVVLERECENDAYHIVKRVSA